MSRPALVDASPFVLPDAAAAEAADTLAGVEGIKPLPPLRIMWLKPPPHPQDAMHTSSAEWQWCLHSLSQLSTGEPQKKTSSISPVGAEGDVSRSAREVAPAARAPDALKKNSASEDRVNMVVIFVFVTLQTSKFETLVVASMTSLDSKKCYVANQTRSSNSYDIIQSISFPQTVMEIVIDYFAQFNTFPQVRHQHDIRRARVESKFHLGSLSMSGSFQSPRG